MLKNCLIVLAFFICTNSFAQNILKPGFNPKEYADLLSLTFYKSSIPDSVARLTATDPYKLVYRSPEMGLLNVWTLYLRNDNVGVIDLRGTVSKATSWLENFYAAAIPATGSLTLNDSTVFNYQFANNPNAQVHVGWAFAIGFLGPDVVAKINEHYKAKGVKEYFISGHSQGGALANLMRSYLAYEIKKGNLPNDLVFKTYSSAAPKVGNMYYAYDFDFMTRGDWAFTIVNAADWVPESPFSLQTLNDFNYSNPFPGLKQTIKKQKLLPRLILGSMYRKMDRSTKKAQARMEKYLGKRLYKMVKKEHPEYKQPAYAGGNNYMRSGVPIILMPSEAYMKKFPDSRETPFVHHMFTSYSFLLNEIYFSSK